MKRAAVLTLSLALWAGGAVPDAGGGTRKGGGRPQNPAAAPALHALGVTPNPRLLPEVASGRGGNVIRVSRRAPRQRKSAGKGGRPDLIGLSMREAVDKAKRLKFSVVLRGHGYVVDQRVETASGRLVLTLKD